MASLRSNRLAPLAVLAAMLLLGAGIHRLFALRFDTGDVLPPYSSFRADPLGTRVLYESLARRGGWRAERIVTPTDESDLAGPGTLFVLSFQPSLLGRIDPSTYDRLAGFARAGGRIVITLPSIQGRDSRDDARARERRKREIERERARRPGGATNRTDRASRRLPFVSPDPDGEEDGGDAPADRNPPVSLRERWAFDVAYSTQTVATAAGPGDGAGGRPDAASIPWHSTAWFTTTGSAWRTVWTRDGLPVVVERPWLGGSIALVSDSYALSNEAILRDRRAGFLAWLAGSGPVAWFDEYHLGIHRAPGLLDFAGRHRLGAVLAALLVLAALFIWRNATSLLPPSDEAGDDARPRPDGFESRDGFVNLIRRHVPPAALASVCLREWRRTAPPADPRLARRSAAMESALRDAGDGARDPVSTYRTLQTVLTEKETP